MRVYIYKRIYIYRFEKFMEKVWCVITVAWHFVSFYITIRCKIHSHRVGIACRWESYFDINDTRWFVNLRPKSPSPVQSRVALRSSNFFRNGRVCALNAYIDSCKAESTVIARLLSLPGVFSPSFLRPPTFMHGELTNENTCTGTHNRVIRCRSNAPPFQNNGFHDARALWNIKIQRYPRVSITR